MPMISRRQFLGRSAAGVAAGALAVHANPLGLPIGFQVYPVRELIAKDFPGTLRQLAKVGYHTVEMCSPPGYVDSGFGPLVSLKGSEIRRIIQDAGLRCESCHFGAAELREHVEDRIGWSKELGLTQMILSSFGLPRDATMDDWRRAAGELNKTGDEIGKAGIQAGYHNHNFEFQKLDGALIYDELMSRLDPKLVRMQFQVAVISLGYEAATYLTKYPGRFISMHLADWSPSDKTTVAVGRGVVDWPKLFAAAKTGGIKNYFVEVNNMKAMQASYPYLHELSV